MTGSRLFVALTGAFAIMACSETSAGLVVTDTDVFAPLPGHTTSVAYLTIKNLSGQPVTVTGMSSPQFRRVELHETVLNNEIARMRTLAAQTIEAGSNLEFNRGGKHIMLFEPDKTLLPGQPVVLHIQFESDAVLIVETTLKNRISKEKAP